MRKWMTMAAGIGLAAAQEPPKKFEAPDRALRQSWQAKAPAPQSPCAIPLLNVLKPAPGAATVKPDPMVIVPRGTAPGRDEVRVPAPSCDDVKK
jgi:hypothetical protein